LGKIGIKLDNDGDISFEGAPAWDAATHVTDGIYLSSVTDKRSDNHIEYNEALVLKEEGNKYHLVAAEQRNTFSANKPFYDATAQGVELTLTDGKFEIKQESK